MNHRNSHSSRLLRERHRTTGFTIVELLIVIVVIGILASITTVAYNGVQVRAEKTKTITMVKSAVKALEIYHTLNNKYPSTATVCLGSGYTDQTGDGIPDCRWGSGNVNPSQSFNAELATAASITAPITQKTVRAGAAGMIGTYFMNDSLGQLDGNPQLDWVAYAVPDKHCGMNVPQLTATYPRFTSKANDTVSEHWGSGGICWVPLSQ